MKKLIVFAFLLTVITSFSIAERRDRWANLRYLAGSWKMETPDVTNTQRYAFIFNGMFLQMKTRAKLVFEKINEKEFIQKFFVAWPNKDFDCYSENHFKKEG